MVRPCSLWEISSAMSQCWQMNNSSNTKIPATQSSTEAEKDTPPARKSFRRTRAARSPTTRRQRADSAPTARRQCADSAPTTRRQCADNAPTTLRQRFSQPTNCTYSEHVVKNRTSRWLYLGKRWMVSSLTMYISSHQPLRISFEPTKMW